MNFVYNDNMLDNATINRIITNNKENVTDARKNFGVVAIENKLYFVKTINKSAPPTLITNPHNDKEVDPTNKVLSYLANNNNKMPFFVTIHSLSQNSQYDYYIMDYIKHGDFKDIVPILNTKWKFTLLMQSLVSIFILNHKIKLFHNDLYYIDVIRNIMIDKVDKPHMVEINLNNTIITLNVKKFCARMIDFGRCSDKQAFRTTEYHNKYFSSIKYISEPLIFTYFYFKTMNVDELDTLTKMAALVVKSSKNQIEFDSKFILTIYNKYKKYIM